MSVPPDQMSSTPLNGLGSLTPEQRRLKALQEKRKAEDTSLPPVAGALAQGSTALDRELDQAIGSDRTAARKGEAELESIDQEAAQASEREASNESTFNRQMDALLAHYPSQAVMQQTALHAAPLLTILAALGGKASGISGVAMLGALNGMVSGINEGSLQKYQQSLDAWKQQLEILKERNAEQEHIYEVMLDAYKNRADAAQKARDFALAMTHDEIAQSQARQKSEINTFKAQAQIESQLDRLDLMFQRVGLARQSEAEKERRDAAQEARWAALDAKTSDATGKARLAKAKAAWTNLKAQADQLLRQRGQVQNSLSLTDKQKQQRLDAIDERIEALQTKMDATMSGAAQEAAASPAAKNAPGATPGTAAAPPQAAPPGVGRSGVIARGAPAAAPSYQTPEQVREAYRAGALTQEQAMQILRDDFGMQ